MHRETQLSTTEDIRISAINLYIKGFPIFIGTLKKAVATETQDILNRLSNLLPKCNDASTALSLFLRSVTPEQLQEFKDIVGETESLLGKVNLEDLYEY